jgi:hypothetical protein
MKNLLKLFTNLKTKKGAMFGIDARVTLAVTSIAAFIVGVNYVTDINRADKNQTIDELNIIKNAVLREYEDTYTFKNIVTLLNEKAIDLEHGEFDVWGNRYLLGYVSQDKTILNSRMNVKYFYIISLGRNAVKDSTNPTSYAGWESFEAAGDDIILKFDSIEVEKQVAEVEYNQIKLVKNLLENFVADRIKQNQDLCKDKSYQELDQCDINQDDEYTFNEELGLNYMPKEIDDTNGSYYITYNTIYNTENKFKSGYINKSSNHQYNMYTFMQVIGGLPDYVLSPRGLVLHFDSNKYGNTQAPYYGEIWYDNEVTIF